MILLRCFALWLVCCGVCLGLESTAPFSDAGAVIQLAEEEDRVWSQGSEFDAALSASDRIYSDPAMTAFVQGVMDKLFPEFKGVIKVRILHSPLLNAFALPNGSIYINQGLLARFENEAQLATVLAHEGVHFINRHGFRTQQTIKSASTFALAVNLLGIPLIGDVLALSSVFGYSRELETEADNQGYQRLKAAGYDVRESPKVFEALIKEIKASDIKEPFFFSSHPKLEERVANFRKLATESGTGFGSSRADYAAKVAKLRASNVEGELSAGRYKSVLLVLNDETRHPEYPNHLHFYIAEAYRLRKDDGDATLCEQNYLKALEVAPQFVPTYRALGIHYLKQKAFADAEKYLGRYLEMAPEATDRTYVEFYLEAARKGKQP